MYTYVLRLHKKVSLVCVSKDLDNRFSFLPWFDKIKTKAGLSADLIIDLDIDSIELYSLFKDNDVELNKKMATALYAGILKDTDGFLNKVDGMVFAVAKALIECGAEHEKCTKRLLKSTTLSTLRLKSMMFKNMILKDDAKEAVVGISDDELKSVGADVGDCYEVMREISYLPYVQEVLLIKTDEQNKVLKKFKKEL